ncbi:hypothetical protein GALMADRAFT_1158665 [Galerina marginata CBS 339.88]|uniref:Uncharacterized protein n=1 Tax=Galerina marginata (strain CBS 339.88) TaxID=685588 RepID=A0A067S8X3_GALM3|nr:hypothetical protein GALMADRAFT_1158665 [Galerina marginata CBS 339.88]
MSNAITPMDNGVSTSAMGLLYGSFVSTFLFGITVTMAWKYFESNSDRWTLRLLVSTSMLIGLASSLCKVLLVHHYLVGQSRDLRALKDVYTFLVYSMTGVIFLLVHVFFAWRLLSLTKSYWIPGLLVSPLFTTGSLGVTD